MAYIYIVRCEDGSLYTGIAKDIGQRMKEHYYKKRSGAKYTRSRRIQSLEMVWETEKWSDAAKLESRIKRLTRLRKEALIQSPEKVHEFFKDTLEGISYDPRPGITLAQLLDQ